MTDSDLIFDWLELSGFMSYPPGQRQRIELNTNKLTAIIGTNFDGGPGERNGAGKTAIIDAIEYLCFGRTTRVSNQGFVNYVESGPMLVSGACRRAGTAFLMMRGENPSLLRLFEKPTNDPRDFFIKDAGKYIFETSKSTKPETTKRIGELLGFDLKLCEILLVNNPSDKSCYFKKEQGDQRDIQERIFGFTIFTEKAERLRELRKEENRNLATKEAAFIATKQANDRVLAEIEQLEEKATTWGVERDRMVRFLTQQIKTYGKIDFEAEAKVLTAIETFTPAIRQLDSEKTLIGASHQQNKARHETWTQRHQDELTTIRQTLDVLSEANAAKDIATLKARDRLRQEIAQLTTQIEAMEVSIKGISKVLYQQMIAAQQIRANIETISAQIGQLGASKCPTCGQDWADTRDHLAHCTAELTKLNDEAAILDNQMEENDTDRRLLQDDCNLAKTNRNALQAELDRLPKTTFGTIEEASSASTRHVALVQKLADTKLTANPYAEPLAQDQKKLGALQMLMEKQVKERDGWRKEIKTYETLADLEEARRNYETLTAQFADYQRSENPYHETIVNLRTKALKEVDETELQALKYKIEHISLLITLLADKDSPIRKAVLNEWLPELNMRVNRYIEFLELPHRVIFDGDMTATFTLRNKPLVFGNLSAGQQLRVWLATNRAFREIFELINYRVNLFFVDEVLDKGMSGRGAEVAYTMLEEMVHQEDKSVFLITHRTELTDLADNVLSINFQNGLSTIVQ